MIIADEERQNYGVDPATRVLTADLRWLPIADLEVGRELVACDEDRHPRSGSRSGCRKMRTCAVKMVRRTRGPAYRIRVDDGRSVVCSAAHRWLLRKTDNVGRWRSIAGRYADGRDTLGPGNRVRFIASYWHASDHPDSWFGGMIDGEGCFSQASGSTMLVVTQCDGPVLHRMLGHCIARGYAHSVDSVCGSKLGRRPVHRIRITGMTELFRVMGLSRPVRFIDTRWWEGRRPPDNGWHAVTAIEGLGEMDLVEIETTTRTYIAEGFVAHDSTCVGARADPREGRPRAAFALPEADERTEPLSQGPSVLP